MARNRGDFEGPHANNGGDQTGWLASLDAWFSSILIQSTTLVRPFAVLAAARGDGLTLMPAAFAIMAPVQCVASTGASVNVKATTRSASDVRAA
jgi:hypothetical protein